MEVFKVGVEIALAGTIMQGLEAVSAKLLGINRDVKLVEAGFKGWGLALGGLSIMGGVSVLAGLKAIADKHHELLSQQNKLYRATQDWQGVVNLTGTAYDKITKAVPTAAASDVLRSVNELRSVTGSIESATAIAPMSLRMEALLSNLTGKDAEGEGFKLWRALEMKGITVSDPATASKLALQMVQNIAGSGGKIDASTYQDLAKRGGAAWIGATPDAINRYSVAAADLGGATAGTAIMSLDQLRTGATTLSRQQLQVLEQAGLIDMSKVQKIPGSNAMNVGPGAIYKSAEDQGNLYQWAQDIAPKLHEAAAKLAQKSGVTEGQAFDSLLAKLGRNRNAIRMLHMFTDPGFMEQATKDIDIWSKNMGLDQAYNTMVGMPSMVTGPGGRVSEAASSAAAIGSNGKHADYAAVMLALQKQWESLMEAVGGPVASAAIPVMRSLTEMFNNLGAIANAHPDAIQMAAKAMGALGVAMIALGGVTVLAAAVAITGPIGAAMTAVGAAIVALAGMNWGAISGPVTAFYDSFNGIAAKAGAAISSAMTSIAAQFVSAIMGIPAAIGGAISSMGASIAAAISHAFGGGDKTVQKQAGFVPPIHPSSHGFIPPSHPATSVNQHSVTGQHADAGTTIHSKTVVMLDGRVLGEAMSSQMASASTFPRQAAYNDTYVGWNAPDNNFSMA